MLDQRIGVSSGKGMKPFGSSMALPTTSSTLGHCGRRIKNCVSGKVSGTMTILETILELTWAGAKQKIQFVS
jgi:hypothetical protein